MEIKQKLDFVERLEKLQKWDWIIGVDDPFASQIDWEEDDKGEWIRAEDIENLIKEIKKNSIENITVDEICEL